MNIKSDNQGFLIGEPIDVDRTLSIWNDIKEDVRAIREALTGKDIGSGTILSRPIERVASSASELSKKQSRQPSIPTPRTINSSRKIAPLPSSLFGNEKGNSGKKERVGSPIASAATPKSRPISMSINPLGRDTKTGRFVKKDDLTGEGQKASRFSNDSYVDSASKNDDGSARIVAEKIISAVGNAGAGMEEADPAVKAFGEVAQPMSRGYEILTAATGREQKSSGKWFRKIFGELKIFRKEESVFNKAANKSLKNIEETPAEASQGTENSSLLRRYFIPLVMAGIGGIMAGSSKNIMDRLSNAHDKTLSTLFPLRDFSEKWNFIHSKLSDLVTGISNKVESAWNAFTGVMKSKFGIDIPKAIAPIVNAGKKAMSIASSSIGDISAAIKRAGDIAQSTSGSVLESVMPKGYRHKAMFDGIKGGESLSQNGTYTDAEASRVRALKTSSANTSANIPGGMPTEIQDNISSQAKKFGLDPVMMQKIAAMESGGNPNAISSTGAIGLYQFTGKTASGVGIKNRFDVDQNIEGAMKLAQQNIATLKKAGLPITEENIYMMHQLGPSAAQDVIRGSASGKSRAELSVQTQKFMSMNHGAGSRTASEYLAANKRALDNRYSSVIGTGKPVDAQSSSFKVPQVPSLTFATKLEEAPRIKEQLASLRSGSRQQTDSSPQDVGQDVKDRRIAHIVTGGLSN